MEQNKKSGLLLAAVITGFVLWLVLLGVIIIANVGWARWQGVLTEDFVNTWRIQSLVFLFAVLAALILAAVLTLLGRNKNNTSLVLIAAIVYIISIFGIPSAVLCFIGRAKLKKQQA